MSNIDIIRAWKDEEYRNSLSEEQRSQLPENPAGLIELSDTQAETVVGGAILSILSFIHCATETPVYCAVNPVLYSKNQFQAKL